MPLDLNWNEQNALYLVVGAIAINWSLMDSAVAQTCDLLMSIGGHKSHTEAPRAFGKRLEFIKLCFRDDGRLAHMRGFCCSLREDTQKLVPHRNFVIHGALTEFDRSNQVFQFTKLDADKDSYSQKSTRLSVHELLEISGATAKVVKDWFLLLEGLHSIRDAADTQ